MTISNKTEQQNLSEKTKFLDLSAVGKVLNIAKEGMSNFVRYSGVFNQKQQEIVPKFDQTNNEVVYAGKTNSFIILGSDRDGGVASGYGGIGDSGVAAIDIVAGMMGSRPVNNINGVVVPAQKNFEYDAARIYITQKGDLDKYLGLPSVDIDLGGVKLPVQQSVAKSGVALKADCIRIVGRENIVIATTNLGTLSSGEPVTPGGIDVYAGAHFAEDLRSGGLQPMVKGNNLASALEALIKEITEIQDVIVVLKEKQQQINQLLANHVHQQNTPDRTYPPVGYNKLIQYNLEFSAQTKNHIIKNIDLNAWKIKYLNAASKDYINSLYNRVN